LLSRAPPQVARHGNVFSREPWLLEDAIKPLDRSAGTPGELSRRWLWHRCRHGRRWYGVGPSTNDGSGGGRVLRRPLRPRLAPVPGIKRRPDGLAFLHGLRVGVLAWRKVHVRACQRRR